MRKPPSWTIIANFLILLHKNVKSRLHDKPIFRRGEVPIDLQDRVDHCDRQLNCGAILYWKVDEELELELGFSTLGIYDDEDTNGYRVSSFHALPIDIESVFEGGNGLFEKSSRTDKVECAPDSCYNIRNHSQKSQDSIVPSSDFKGEAAYYISHKEWLIQRGIVTLPFWHGHPAVLLIELDIDIEQARKWCLTVLECVAFFFPLESSKDLKVNDFTVFVSDVPMGFNVGPGQTQVPRIYIKQGDREKGSKGEANIARCEWVTHIIHDRLRKRLQFEPERLRRFDSSQLGHFWKVSDDIIFVDETSEGEESLIREFRLAHSPYRPCCEPYREKRLPLMQEVFELDHVPRISCDISRENFYKNYESKRQPVVLTGCADKWSAQLHWDTIETFQQNTGTNDTLWEACTFKSYPMSIYKELMASRQTFCAFDNIVGEKEELISSHYSIPPPFENSDFFEPLGKEFPIIHNPMKWFSWGTTRSSSQAHYDQHLPSTDTWNTLVRGQKWWILFPDSHVVHTEETQCDLHCSTLTSVYERFIDWQFSYAVNAHKFYFEEGKRPLHIVQKAGETLYIPDGWMHSLYNQDSCIAVTHSYGSPANLPNLWKQLLIHGKPRHWRKMYYTHMDSSQRKQVREAVKEDRICVVQSEMSIGTWLICDDSDFAQTFRAKI